MPVLPVALHSHTAPQSWVVLSRSSVGMPDAHHKPIPTACHDCSLH